MIEELDIAQQKYNALTPEKKSEFDRILKEFFDGMDKPRPGPLFMKKEKAKRKPANQSIIKIHL